MMKAADNRWHHYKETVRKPDVDVQPHCCQNDAEDSALRVLHKSPLRDWGKVCQKHRSRAHPASTKPGRFPNTEFEKKADASTVQAPDWRLKSGAGMAQWLERWTRDWKVASSNPCRTAGEFSSPGSSFCADSDFGIRSTPVTVLLQQQVKDPSHSAKSAGGKLQLKCMHAPYVCDFAWSDMVHDWMVYTERTETAAVSCGTSHVNVVSTPLRWILKNAL